MPVPPTALLRLIRMRARQARLSCYHPPVANAVILQASPSSCHPPVTGDHVRAPHVCTSTILFPPLTT